MAPLIAPSAVALLDDRPECRLTSSKPPRSAHEDARTARLSDRATDLPRSNVARSFLALRFVHPTPPYRQPIGCSVGDGTPSRHLCKWVYGQYGVGVYSVPLPQRTAAAAFAISARRSGVRLSALALPPFSPPFRPRATAAGSFSRSSARSFPPVASSTMDLASVLRSNLRLRERSGMTSGVCAPVRGSVNFRESQTDPLPNRRSTFPG